MNKSNSLSEPGSGECAGTQRLGVNVEVVDSCVAQEAAGIYPSRSVTNFSTTVEERDFYREQYERMLKQCDEARQLALKLWESGVDPRYEMDAEEVTLRTG